MENNFVKNLEELELIVKDLESGNVSLDDAISKYSKAMKLAKKCSDKLKDANEQVSKIIKEDGTFEDFKEMSEE